MILKGNLDLSNSNIESLGNLKEVGRDLWLNGSKITSLPNGLKVRRSLDLNESKITKEYILNNFPELLNKSNW